MSVYTAVDRDELAAWLLPLGVGELIDHAGIAAGMQNSNYFVTTTCGRYVLTLFESADLVMLDFHLRLQLHLATRGLPCPQPLTDPNGLARRSLRGKPAALLSCLPGQVVEQPLASHCLTLGGLLARLHLAALDCPDVLPNPCGAGWRQTVGQSLLPYLPAEDAALLADELRFQAGQDWRNLPSGVIHADLFRDNVLWLADGRPGGVLDFYFSGVDAWLFDLAVVANDWCQNAASLTALLDGYRAVRPLTDLECCAWPAVRRAAALRFWLLRLEAMQRPRPGEVVTIKDPAHFRHLLEQLRLAQEPLPG